jgi:hypothetical protein
MKPENWNSWTDDQKCEYGGWFMLSPRYRYISDKVLDITRAHRDTEAINIAANANATNCTAAFVMAIRVEILLYREAICVLRTKGDRELSDMEDMEAFAEYLEILLKKLGTAAA